MKLQDRFHALNNPSKDYAGEPLDEARFSRNIYFAKNKDNRNCFLIRVQQENRPFAAPSLKEINILFQVQCTIETDQGPDRDYWTIIEFNSEDDFKEDLFFTQMESIFGKLEFPCKTSDVSTLLQALFSLFKLLSRPGKSKLQGLWAELYLIYKSKDARELMRYWHINKSERYDFTDQEFRVEVKSCGTSNYRKHKLSHRQAYPPDKTVVIIASVIAEEISNGLSIKTIYEALQNTLIDEVELMEKLNLQCVETLGRDFETNITMSFDEQQAEQSLKFFDIRSIPKIEQDIPQGVEDLSYSSDLSIVNPINREEYSNKSVLFSLSMN